jgi:hypothetical protein
MTTRGQDGAAGAGAHAQAEAVGLGPTTVVRLEGALTHKVLRYCTAIRRSALKVVRGQGGTGPLFDEMVREVDRPQSEARGHERHRGGYTGMRKRPSSTGVIHGTGVGGARSNSCGLPGASCLPGANASGENVLCWSGSAPCVRRHAERDMLF